MAVPDGEGFRFESRLHLSLTLDHQCADGADGARFLAALADSLGNLDLVALMGGA